MKWGRKDYYGSRSYETEPPAVGQFSLIAAWFANIAMNKFRRRGATAPFEGARLSAASPEPAAEAELRGSKPRFRRSTTIHDGRDCRVLP